ncbi:uncharacterized protein PV07_11558 [Cladophialophora immunda]|uniref:Zn(2)-C6 fungal-type domain-containing protein n=1 Tax=Cladophialophora immunda TaxID=569365 RepID=A0A0D1Z6V4_9EURO|nr:uncharacterized protein PV07_11558 [Cladophialophora immunda]KIW23351.1 hypothetical protein PV07_11558 [Cladophialophora immunda]OQV07033.1 Fungal Zn2-Cys6 binuclear cluster domain-containing protein [Cladophialophora immunda]
MFHTFETAQYHSPEQAEQNASSAAKRRTSTVRACEPCRRRKIRCSGEHPCETCQWYRKAASCHYTEPRQRQMPSRRSVEKISQTLQDYRAILQKLFPNVHPDQLKELPRERLVELIQKSSPFHPPSPRTPSVEEKPPPMNPDAANLEQLQPTPADSNDGFPDRKTHALKGITDDVNMLSLSVKQNSSYLGISSVMAVLRVITWLDPDCLTKSPERSVIPTREPSPAPENHRTESDQTRNDTSSASAWDEIPLINAYFSYVHPFIPLIEEQVFRDTYMAAQRTDSRWLLLLNSVLAMGSVAAGSSDDTGHHVYFNRAKQHLNMDTLDSAHLETVQALAILSGFYLHYVQIPNQANALMGATLRVATTLGLHRDYTEGVGPAKIQKASFSIEMRRRIWWCTFILDAWAGNTLGRPSMGRMSHAITAKPPQEPIGQSTAMLALVQENVRFCIISTKMEDALAVSPLLEEYERCPLDALYLEWYKHSSVQSDSSHPNPNEPRGVTVVKNVMRWRYLSNRIILHRPALLWYAMRKIPWESLSPERQAAIELCRGVCAELINDIACTWRGQKACQMSGWNATWLLYQAVMVPLLSLYSDPHDVDVVESSRHQVEVAMQVFKELQGWSSTARRSLEVILRLYEASKRHSAALQELQETYLPNTMDTPTSFTTPAPQHAQLTTMPTSTAAAASSSFRPTYIDVSFANTYGNLDDLNTATQELFMDNMFDTLNWSTSWDSPIGGTPMMNGWDYSSMHHWAGIPQADEYFGGFGLSDDPGSQMGVVGASDAGGAGVGTGTGPAGGPFDVDMHAAPNPGDIMNGHYAHNTSMDHRHP